MPKRCAKTSSSIPMAADIRDSNLDCIRASSCEGITDMFCTADCLYGLVYRRQPETARHMPGGCLSGHGDQSSLRTKRTLLGTTRRIRDVEAILATRLWNDRSYNVSILFPLIASQMISRYLNFRYTIVRDTKPDLTTPGRYILGNKGHFQGLVVHFGGTVILTTNHRTADNIIITPQRLLDMQMEAVLRLVPRGCGERLTGLTERSGGSHLSAGAASACGSCNARGGGSCLLPELLSFLPSYYFCLKHLSTLAACSRSMKEQVLNKHHWKDCHLDFEVSDLLHDQQAMRVLSRWWENVRTINLSQHQLTQLSGHGSVYCDGGFLTCLVPINNRPGTGQFTHFSVAHVSSSIYQIM